MTGFDKQILGSLVSLVDQASAAPTHRVTSVEQDGTCVVRHLHSGQVFSTQVTSLVPWEPAETASESVRMRELEAVSQESLAQARQKLSALKPVLDIGRTTVEQIKTVANAAGVHAATVYRWRKRVLEGRRLSELVRKTRADKGKGRLDEKVEKVISTSIGTVWKSEKKPTFAALHDDIVQRCRGEGLDPPSRVAVAARLRKVDPLEAAIKRGERIKAGGLKLNKGQLPNVDGPYSILQIDHTRLDVILVDSEHRVPIGRPWITVAIDVYSRMVAGYYVAFDTPGVLGTGLCISHAVLPKARFLREMNLDYSYPCSGRPKIIHVDNAKEFHSTALANACEQYGFGLQFRKVKNPQYGGHIERLMGTLAHRLRKLDGATFSNPQMREEYDSEANATMTIQDFQEWLAHLIIGRYHHELHTGIGEPPIHRYLKAVTAAADSPQQGDFDPVTDEERFRIDLLPMYEVTVQQYGVRLDYVTYACDPLRRWVGAKDPSNSKEKRKFIARRDPRNISYIYFFEPDSEQYIKVPYARKEHPTISLWELRAAKKHAQDEGAAAVDEAVIFRSWKKMEQVAERSRERTASVKLDRANKARARRRESSQATAFEPSVGDVPVSQDLVSNPTSLDRYDGDDEIERM
jgi:putative transposase